MLRSLIGLYSGSILYDLYLARKNWCCTGTESSVDAVKQIRVSWLKRPLIKLSVEYLRCLSFARTKPVNRCFCAGTYLGLLMAFLLSACDSPTSGPVFTQPPTLMVHPGAAVPLSTLINFEADQPVVASYTITAGDRTWQAHTRSSAATDQASLFKSKHQEVLLRFLPDTEHRIIVQITNAQGQSSQISQPLVLQTPPLPKGFPTVEGNNTYGLYQAPGITLLSVVADGSRAEQEPDKAQQKTTEPAPGGWLIGLDDTASIVWYMPTDWRWQTIEPLPSGNLRLYSDLGSSLEVDMLGNNIRAWAAIRDVAGQRYFQQQGLQPIRAEIEGMHHRRQLLPNGNSLVLSYEIEYLSTYFPNTRLKTGKTEPLLGDIIIEVSPSGETVRQWRLADLVDSSRRTLQADTSTPLFDSASAKPAAQIAWSGASGLVYDPAKDRIIVALRNQQALVGIDYFSGQLKWILADPRGWKSPWAERLLSVAPRSIAGSATDTLIWPQGLGQPHLGQNGEIILLDQRVPGSESRVLSYTVDETTMTFVQNSSYRVEAYPPARLQYIDPQQRILLGTAVDDATQHASRLSHFPLKSIVSNSEDKPQPEYSLRLGNVLIEDLLVVSQLLPPQFPAPQSHTTKTARGRAAIGTQDLAANSPTTEAPITDKTMPLAEGDWRISVGPPGQQSQQILKIDQQQGDLALGYLDQYPVMVMLKGDRMRFTYRSSGTKGSASWKFRGSLSAGGHQVEGLLSIYDAAGQTLAAQIPWQGTKQ